MNTSLVHCRTLFLSDIHLGNRACQAEALIKMLSHCKCERIYLVGDIIDFWAQKKTRYWPASHQNVLNLFTKLAADGVQITYLPGNHDGALRAYCDGEILGIKITRRAIHTTADNKRLLVTHGDEFDSAVLLNRLHSLMGDYGYDCLLWANRIWNLCRSIKGKGHWSLAKNIKKRLKGANEAVARYRQAALDEVKRQELDGIVCGHIHCAEMHQQGDQIYCNTGDWIESFTAIQEDFQGNLSQLNWDISSTTKSKNAA